MSLSARSVSVAGIDLIATATDRPIGVILRNTSATTAVGLFDGGEDNFSNYGPNVQVLSTFPVVIKLYPGQSLYGRTGVSVDLRVLEFPL